MPVLAQSDHPTPAERVARGKAARAEVRRSAHADWEPASDRPDPVGLLEQQARTRVPELVPIRYGRMLLSPLAFFRGAAAIMAADLSPAPRTGLAVQLSGDAHLFNFGVFAASDRRLVFSLNDFDETLPGPFEWDVKRLVASFEVAGRERGFDRKQRRKASLTAMRSYRLALHDFAQSRTLDVWYGRLEVEAIVQQWTTEVRKKRLNRVKRDLAKRTVKDNLRALDKLTEVVDGNRRIVSDPPLVVPLEELVSSAELEQMAAALHRIYESYRRTLMVDRRQLLDRFGFTQVARKVVGVGSVGTRTWIVLLLGRDDEDPLFLQLKEAQSSVLEPFLGGQGYANQGQRVVVGQWLTQAARDALLGWTRAPDADGVERDYYVRQLWDGKASADVEALDPKSMALYAEVCGRTLAHSHARSGDPIALAAYLGDSKTFDHALATFAEAYADQNERDYAALRSAADSGRVKVEPG